MKFFQCFLLFFLLENPLLAQSETTPPPAEDTTQYVLTGMYLMNLYDLNLDEHSFYADFYIWFKWTGDLDPTEIEFVNAVEKWGLTQLPFEDSTLVLEDGYNYQGFRVEGRFFHPFLLDQFPLDRHELEIHMEHPDYSADAIRYIPDTTSSPVFYRPELVLAGWNIQNTQLASGRHDYGTNFGNPYHPADIFSKFVFRMTLVRPTSYFLLKLLLPLTIVLFAAIGGLLFFPSYVDARMSLPVGSLLTAVFLQQGYSNALPDVGYMVLMDKIYLLSYALIGVVILRLIVTGNRTRYYKKDHVHLRTVKRREWRLAGILVGVYVVGIFLLVLMGWMIER